MHLRIFIVLVELPGLNQSYLLKEISDKLEELTFILGFYLIISKKTINWILNSFASVKIIIKCID